MPSLHEIVRVVRIARKRNRSDRFSHSQKIYYKDDNNDDNFLLDYKHINSFLFYHGRTKRNMYLHS